jgi:hypothetical protein
MQQSMKMLQPAEVTAMWSVLEPMLARVEASNEISQDEGLSPDEIYDLVMEGLCALFVYFEDDAPKLVLGLQFNETGRQKHAEIIAMAGEGLMRFKAAYWDYFLSWLRANKIKRLDAHGNTRVAHIYQKKFGFDKSCVLVRQAL